MSKGEHKPARVSTLRRVGVRLGVAVLVLAVALAGLWLARKPIARNFVDSTLAEAKVPARYTIEELGFGHQRLTNVRLGDPAHPDLVADWVELQTSVGFNGARVEGISAGHVRVRARIVDGVLSLGSIDRLIPKSGGAFKLPAISLSLEDGRMRLETLQGVAGIKAYGRGRLDGGFRGSIAAITPRMASGDCAATEALAVLAVDIRADAIRLSGPVRAVQAGCSGSGGSGLRADVDASIASAFDKWHGEVKLAADRAMAPSVAFGMLAGTLGFAGDARGVQGKVALNAATLAGSGIAGQAGAIDGAYRYRDGKGAFTGTAQIGRAALPIATRSALARFDASGTPVGPLVAQLARAVDAAGRDFALTADFSAATDGARGAVKLSRLLAVAESGASVTLSSSDGTQFAWPGGGATLRGDLVIGGGGLPELSARLDQAQAGAPITGVATLEPYEAGGARLALTPVRFSAGFDGRTRIESIATLSGPLAGGAVDGLSLPLLAQWDERGSLSVNPACAPLAVGRLRLAGLDARNVRTGLCPVDGAMLRLAGGRIGGGAVARDVQLKGVIGSSPLALSAASATLRLGDRRFALDKLAVRIGAPDRLTRFDIATLDGAFGKSLAGTFGSADGQIGAVPLILSKAAGTWRVEGSKLLVGGTLAVSDAAPAPRFSALAVNDVALTLADNRIDAIGVLVTPESSIKVADVRLAHDLGTGNGNADLTIASLAFNKVLQPDDLTPLTKGVIADVAGVVTGGGHIVWTSDTVTSTGRFATRDMNLAAAFGPVTGLTTELRFTDLLGMVSAPDQVATVKTVDTGIAVSDGVVRYQVMSPNRLRIADARWPFAGGRLSLDPTLLDFVDPGGQRLTFRLTGVDAAQFLQLYDFKNLNATGVFDGELPMIFDATGGRIEKGRLKVREGGGTIAYVGEVTKEDVGFWGNLAFQALKSLKYRSLDLTMNGPLAGEVITEARFAGVAQGAGTKSNFLIRRLQKLPFVFNVKIRAPFRSLLNSAAGFIDPRTLIRGQIPVQPPASEKVP